MTEHVLQAVDLKFVVQRERVSAQQHDFAGYPTRDAPIQERARAAKRPRALAQTLRRAWRYAGMEVLRRRNG
jgi:hypothetical protein